MKKPISYFLFLIIIFVCLTELNAKIAVVESKFDKVGDALRSRKINFDIIKYEDLENKAIYLKYKSIFIPCGIENSIKSNVNVQARGTKIKSVALKTNFYEIDINKVINNIEKFVESGGSLYVSGYSFKYLQKAFGIFTFFSKFPYMGSPGRIESNLKNDLNGFILKDKMALYMDHQGWIAVKSAKDSIVIADATFKTPRGIKQGVISIIYPYGKGEVLFTSYHSTIFSEFRRFNIYRIAGAELFKELSDYIKDWEQEPNSKIADAINKNEYFRKYKLQLRKGENTILFTGGKGYYQVDIFDEDMSLIESRGQVSGFNVFNIANIQNEKFCFVKIYPSTNDRNNIFAFASCNGLKIFPYFKKIMYALAVLFLIIFCTFLYSLFNTRYSGRFRVF